MAFGDLLGEAGVNVASLGINYNFARDIIIFLFLCIIAAGFTYWYVNKKSYNKQIIKFREVNGITRRVGIEKAKEIVLPNTSVRAFYLKNSNFYIPRPSIETSENEYWYFIRDDGEWVNVGLGNMNDELEMLGLKIDHTDMRMANAALKKLVDRSYKKTDWIKTWAPYIGFGIIIIMLGISGYLMTGESAKVVSAAANNVEHLSGITESLKEILSNLDNIGSTSGVKVAA